MAPVDSNNQIFHNDNTPLQKVTKFIFSIDGNLLTMP